MWDRLTLERELTQLGVRESADMHGLREYQVATQSLLPVQTFLFKDWWDVIVKLTAAATPDNVTIKGDEKVDPLVLDRPKRMSIRAGGLARHQRGQVDINLTIEHKRFPGSAGSRMLSSVKFDGQLRLKFLCTAEGGIWLDRGSPPRRTTRGYDLGVDIEVYQRKDKPKQRSPMHGIPSSVWDEWMKTLRIFRVVVIAKLTRVSKTGAGWLSVDFKHPSVSIPEPIVARATDLRTAQLGPMIIDLVPEDARPPLTTKKDIIQDVFFGVDSSKLDKIVEQGYPGGVHQGNKLDAWIRDNLIARWDVRQALLRGDLPVRGEARASATLKGKGKSSQEFVRYLQSLSEKRRNKVVQELLAYNQGLSERRRDAVINRLTTTITRLDRDIQLAATQIKIKAIGAITAVIPDALKPLISLVGVIATGSSLGEENVSERLCRIRIAAADLDAAIRKLYKAPHRWWWDR